MRNKNLLSEIEKIAKEMDVILEYPTYADSTMDPRMIELLAKGIAIYDELDGLMRGTFRDRPDALALWEQRVQAFRETDPEGFLEYLRWEAQQPGAD